MSTVRQQKAERTARDSEAKPEQEREQQEEGRRQHAEGEVRMVLRHTERTLSINDHQPHGQMRTGRAARIKVTAESFNKWSICFPLHPCYILNLFPRARTTNNLIIILLQLISE